MATVLGAILQSFYADVSRNVKADPWDTFVWSHFQKYPYDCTEKKCFFPPVYCGVVMMHILAVSMWAQGIQSVGDGSSQ